MMLQAVLEAAGDYVYSELAIVFEIDEPHLCQGRGADFVGIERQDDVVQEGFASSVSPNYSGEEKGKSCNVALHKPAMQSSTQVRGSVVCDSVCVRSCASCAFLCV